MDYDLECIYMEARRSKQMRSHRNTFPMQIGRMVMCKGILGCVTQQGKDSCVLEWSFCGGFYHVASNSGRADTEFGAQLSCLLTVCSSTSSLIFRHLSFLICEIGPALHRVEWFWWAKHSPNGTDWSRDLNRPIFSWFASSRDFMSLGTSLD